MKHLTIFGVKCIQTMTMMKNKLVILFLLFSSVALADSPILPDAQLTAGQTDYNATKEMVCTPGYSAKVRHVPESLKRDVFKRYGINSTADKFQVDHLISLELGGTNDITNLWPQSYTNPQWNAHDKDKLENRLHKLVCYGAINIVEAQIAIYKNWIEAYKKYIGDK